MPGGVTGRRWNRRSSPSDQAIPAVNPRFLAFFGIFWHFLAERGRGAGGCTVFAEALTYTAISAASTESRRLTAVGAMRRRRICIGLPQQGQRNAGRGLSDGGGRGAILSTTCSRAIRLLRLGCRKP